MASTTAIPLPKLDIPSSNSIVKVSIIDNGVRMKLPRALFLTPSDDFQGHEWFNCPSYSFLIENGPLKRKIIFDLGMRKDWENNVSQVVTRFKGAGCEMNIGEGKDVADVLTENGVDLASIEGVIWSHVHFDHIGNMQTFPSSTALIVGPGFNDELLPCFPTNPESQFQPLDYLGRDIKEIEFKEGLKIGRFNAHDYFNDGSVFLLDSPGHEIGHLCALVRTTPTTFIFLGGDACHHAGTFRPSPYIPLNLSELHECLVEEKRPYLQSGRITPFYHITIRPKGHSVNYDDAKAIETVRKLVEFDGYEDIFTVIAHDSSLLDVLDFFPQAANQWKEKKWAETGKWKFLSDF